MFPRFRLLALLFILFLSGSAYSQSFSWHIQQITLRAQYDTILSHLQHWENLGVKQPNTPGIDSTRDWIIRQYQQYGYSQVSFDTFPLAGDTLYNIIIDKTGDTYPDQYLVVCGHYDTKIGPGVNDNGSGVVAIMEAARVIQDIPTRYSIKFIHFAGEEQDLAGSAHYVDHIVVPQGMNIKLVLNVDEVGGIAGMANNFITTESDQGGQVANNFPSAWYTDTLARMMQYYGGLQTQPGPTYSSDYMSFEPYNYVITGLFETNETPYKHSIEDSLSKLDTSYVYDICKGLTGAILYLAKADQYLGTPTVPEAHLDIYPNPAMDQLQVNSNSYPLEGLELTLTGMDGRQHKQVTLRGPANTIPLSDLDPGVYIGQVFSARGALIFRQKITIIR